MEYGLSVQLKCWPIRLGRDATLEELSAATELAREDIVMALEASSEVESLHKTVFQKEGSEFFLWTKFHRKKMNRSILLNQICRAAFG